MRRFFWALALACGAHAGAIKGIVTEAATGHALARTLVRLQPLKRTGAPAAKPMTERADSSGSFTFPPIPDGMYILTASREFYFPAAFGQRRPTGQGTPIVVTAESTLFAELRMRRMGVITGRVVDENDVGIPNVRVAAYRAKLPAEVAARGVSDDRGVYRIFGLAAGKYWVRSMAQTLEDGSEWLPTFGPDGVEAREARVHEVKIDEETEFADVHPRQGRLFALGGAVGCPNVSLAPVTVVLSSAVEKKTTVAACGSHYRFDALAPAVYEILATSADYAGAFIAFADHDSDAASVTMRRKASALIEATLSSGGGASPAHLTVTGHRADLAGSEPDSRLTSGGLIAPGHWLINADAGPGTYVESITDGGAPRDPHTLAADAFDVNINASYTRLTITVSTQVATIDGTVKAADSRPVPGAPVFLWPLTEAARRSLGGAKQMLADDQGRYSFENLPPGDYQLLATFDEIAVDEEILRAARAVDLRVSAGQRSTLDLPLWIAP